MYALKVTMLRVRIDLSDIEFGLPIAGQENRTIGQSETIRSCSLQGREYDCGIESINQRKR